MMSFEDKISLMIPAYLRGELSEEDQQQVETLAAQNPDFAADIELQRNIKLALVQDEEAYEPGDLGWAKLSKAMEVSNETKVQSVSQPKFWRYAAAILAVAVIGQAGVLGSLTLNKAQDAQQGAQYVTASDSSVGHYTVKMAFNTNATGGQITQTLQSVSGVIIDGPNSLGLYQLEFKSKSDCQTAAERFQSQGDIIQAVFACE